MTEPLTPAYCDLRGLQFMPLDVVRLLDSDLFALTTGDEFKAAVALWCKSWNQVPAASLPADDRILARFASLSLREWSAVKEQALKGWILADDGRLYHPVVAEKANEAWAYRERQRERVNKRWAKVRGDAAEVSRLALTAGNSGEHTVEHTAVDTAASAPVGTAEIQGTGTGTVKKDAIASSGADAPTGPSKTTIRELAERIWALQPVIGGKRRSTRPDVAKALSSALKRGGEPKDILTAAEAYYRLPDCTKDGGQYASGAAVVLNADRWKEYLPPASAKVVALPTVAAVWTGPEDVRAAIAGRIGDGYARSYVDTAVWDEEARTITPRTSVGAAKIRQDCWPELKALNVTVLNPAPKSAGGAS